MQNRDDQSFDPRTWNRPEPEQAPPTRDEDSFDPRSWAGPEPALAAPAAEAAAPRRDGTKAPPRTMMLAGGAAALIFGAGGLLALLARPEQGARSAPALVAAAADAAPAPLPASASLSMRKLVIPGSAALVAALLDAGLPQSEASAAARAALDQLGTREGDIRAVLTLDISGPEPKLARLEASFEDSSGAVVTRQGDGSFTASKVAASLSSIITVIRGEMDAESFYSSAVTAGVTDTLIPDFAKAFAFDFDFQREIRPGDVFEAAFEQQKNAAGQPVGHPKLLYASMTTEAKSRALYWFQPPGEEPGWFDGNGSSIIRSLMRTPVDGARVSSNFGFRKHPVLGYQKLHKGTDFAAPTGTPIYASGNAVVEFAGPRGAAGNFVNLRHDNGWNTWYMHLNAFAPGLAAGVRLTQGQPIGEVGTTGRSTGPHLHYEVRIDGEPVDPLSIQTESGRTLAGEGRAAFVRERDRIDVARANRGG